MKKEYPDEFKKEDTVVARYGWNDVLLEPFEFLYEFGYYSQTRGKCVVYKQGECNMQDSYVFDVANIRLATKEDKKEYYWGR